MNPINFDNLKKEFQEIALEKSKITKRKKSKIYKFFNRISFGLISTKKSETKLNNRVKNIGKSLQKELNAKNNIDLKKLSPKERSEYIQQVGFYKVMLVGLKNFKMDVSKLEATMQAIDVFLEEYETEFRVNEIIKEIRNSEMTFYDDICRLELMYQAMQEKYDDDAIPEILHLLDDLKKAIFPLKEELRAIARLRNNNDKIKKINDLYFSDEFNNYCEKLLSINLYFSANGNQIEDLLKVFCADDDLKKRDYNGKIGNDAFSGKNLIIAIQRLPRHEMLANALLKKSKHKELEEALNNIKEKVSYINNAIREQEPL